MGEERLKWESIRVGEKHQAGNGDCARDQSHGVRVGCLCFASWTSVFGDKSQFVWKLGGKVAHTCTACCANKTT